MSSRPNRRCINCSLLLRPHMRRHPLVEVTDSTLNILRSWITPTPINSGDFICEACFQVINQSTSEAEPVRGHRSVCFGCGVSILESRTHRVPLDCPERNVILRWTSPHLVSHLERVCRACWMSATREVRRQAIHDAQRLPSLQIENENHQNIPVAPPLPPQRAPVQDNTSRAMPRIVSHVYKRVSAASTTCLFAGCENHERLLVPSSLKELLLWRYQVYVPLTARICNDHLNDGNWADIRASFNTFTSFQMDNMMHIMKCAGQRHLDFSNIAHMDPHIIHYWLGLNSSQFNSLLEFIPQLREMVPCASVALSILLVKLRTGDSNERLSSLFKMSRTTLERHMNKARNCLLQTLIVPMYLGLSHTNVTEVASRNKIIPEGLFGNPEMPAQSKPAIVICDGTYIYVQSSSNYSYQKKTYSTHKYANLVKPFLFVCCDGYILECLGPYSATQNDSSIMSDAFRSENSEMRRFFRENDVFLLDRGFRDVIPELQAHGYKAHMPESLQEGEHQLTTLQANKSRCLTMCRWVVEVVNGRIKRDYKLFRQEYFNCASTHLMKDLKIACALLNKFHPPIEDSPHAAQYLEIALSKINENNHLANYIISENMNRRRAIFQTIDGYNPHLNGFPKLTLEDLKKFALGTYQLKQARSYFGEHMRENGRYILEIANEIDEDMPLILGINNYLVRGRVKSRHIGGKTYYCYMLISRDVRYHNTVNSIVGYYCNCLVGKRTVGCCAHTMSVLWYLSWARYNNITAPASFLDHILCEG